MKPDLRWPHVLTWSEVEPITHAFNPAAARAIAFERLPEEKPTNEEAARKVGDEWEHLITQDLVEHYGEWARGWRWAGDEGSIGGGPVHEWCCPSHSWTARNETADRVQSALADWRNWIEKLAARFSELAPVDRENTINAFEVAVAELVNDVVERTSAGDAWYEHCRQVLSWYFEYCGVTGDNSDKLITDAIGGSFESWIAPEDEAVQEMAKAIASDIANLERKEHD